MLEDSYLYKAFYEAVAGGVLSQDETDDLEEAAKDGTTAILLNDWAQNHSDQDFRQICADTLEAMGVEVE